ncbi:MAG TPA: insulinase family protein [Firmicutes bacterium]|nr:insulinase family protein [Bacillota bacterium]
MRGIGTAVGLSRQDYDALRETVYHTRLANGLRIYVMPKPDYNEKYAVFATRYGSIDTTFIPPGEEQAVITPPGVAHFLEHKLFEGEGSSAFETFAGLGASVNAYTTYGLTSYLFSTTDNFYQCLEALVDFVQHPYFTEESVAKEQGIIAQEISMYEDNPSVRVYNNLLQAMYHYHPVREKIAGTIESVAAITPRILYRCHSTFYHPENMILFAIGNIDPEKVVRAVESRLRADGHAVQGTIRRVYPSEPESVKEARIEEQMSVARPLCYLGFKDNQLASGDELLQRQLAASLSLQILFGKTSALYNRLYESGLIDNSFTSYYTAEESFAYSIVGGVTPDPLKLEEAILAGLKEARENGIAQEEFGRQKRKSIGGFLYALNSLDFIANNFISTRFRGSSLFSYLDVLQNLRIEDVERCLEEQLIEERLSVSIIWPRHQP